MYSRTLSVGALLRKAVPFALLFTLYQLPAHAQHTYDYWSQPRNTNESFKANRSSSWPDARPRQMPRAEVLSDVAAEASRLDFERVRTAWENYRREAIRYQSRYGEQNFLRNGGRRFENRGPRSNGSGTNLQEPRLRGNVTPAASIQDVRDFDFARPGFRNEYRDCPRRAADTRPRLAPTTPAIPYRGDERPELNRGLTPYSGDLRLNSVRRQSFQSPQPLRAVPSRRSELEQRRDPGVFSTPKIDPSQLASRAEAFFSSYLGN